MSVTELNDPRTQAEVWGDKMSSRSAGSLAPSAMHQIDHLLHELTCFVCERRWVGVRADLMQMWQSHRHPARMHLSWFVETTHGWPEEFLELMEALLQTLDEFGAEGRDRLQEISDRLTNLDPTEFRTTT